MITLSQYWMGRDFAYAADISPAIIDNAAITVTRVNRLLAAYEAATRDTRPRAVSSGWRPPAVNASVPGAAARSKHMTGEAVDIADASRSLKNWLMTEAGQAALINCELWMEHPDSTPTWAHLQTIPPRSGNRVFWP